MENEGEEDGREREVRNEKAFTLCEKRRAEGKVGKISRKNRPKSDPKRGKTREKWASQGEKRARFLKNRPKTD